MYALNVQFEISNKIVSVELLNEREVAETIHQYQGILDADNSKFFNSNIYNLNNGKILTAQRTHLIYGIITDNLDDFYLIRTQASLLRLAEAEDPFYTTNYRGKKDIYIIIEKYSGQELPEYSSGIRKLFLLNNGKYLEVSELEMGSIDFWEAYLYNSLDDAKRTNLFERLRDQEL